MSLSKAMRFLSLITITLWLTGCAEFNSLFSERTPPQQVDPCPPSDIDALLDFGANMANLTETDRADLCTSLLKTQKLSPSTSNQLHLMVGRLLSEACGDIPKILEATQLISSSQAVDKNVQNLITIHSAALTRMHKQSKKSSATQQKSKKSKSAAEVKETQDIKENEAQLLREKLEAIRSLEKQMDENLENN